MKAIRSLRRSLPLMFILTAVVPLAIFGLATCVLVLGDAAHPTLPLGTLPVHCPYPPVWALVSSSTEPSAR